MQRADLNKQYSQPQLGEKLLSALQSAGKNLGELTVEDLHPFDEFHSMGLKATRELSQLGKVAKEDHVLDIGCGIGGPARTLASETGCRVTGVDFIEEYVGATIQLTERVGLASLTDFQQGDATSLRFADSSFDVVWSQHVTMNIPEKRQVFNEIMRVLKPGGHYLFQEVCKGECDGLLFPVPWADSERVSFLCSVSEFKSLLDESDLHQDHMNDVTESANRWFRRIVERGDPPSLSIARLMGSNASKKLRNLADNYERQHITMLQGVYVKPQ